MLPIPTLESARLRLVPLSRADSEGMFALFSRAEVCRYSGPAQDLEGREIPLPVTHRDGSDRLLDYWLARAREGSGFRWALHRRPETAFVGAVGFNQVGACCECAFHLVPDAWGQGLAAEASRLALQWARSRGAREVEAYVDAGNRGSVRLLERLGFAASGDAREGAERWALSLGAG